MMQRFSLRNYSIGVGLLLIWVFFAVRTDTFLTPRNISNLSIELSITATLALGMLLVLLPGQIDLSVGSGVGLMGGIAGVLIFHRGWPAPAAMGAALVSALVLWFLMGSVISRQRVPAFIITLGGLMLFKGAFWKVISNETVPVVAGNEENLLSILTTYTLPSRAGYVLCLLVSGAIVAGRIRSRQLRRAHGFEVEPWQTAYVRCFIGIQIVLLFTIVMNQFRGIPLAALILGGVALVIHVLTMHTPFGRYLYAIGGNEEAAVLSGISVERVVTGAYVLLGGIVALTGFMQTSYAGASTTTVGDLMELDAIAACVIGGTSLSGGRGSVLGVLIGALIMASLLNGMTLMAVSPEIKYMARGLVLALAVWMDIAISRRGSGA